ncbi:MAG: hypothetical protein FGM33_02225 [Candidatus Kapabacteria bacterium]|nr:hypothetical protein [Candidatus Kapabacteria bacterium]
MRTSICGIGLTSALLALVLSSCTIINRPPRIPPPETQLQTREFQTREFDTNDVKLIMKAMLNVLQDDGFVVKNAVIDLGLLTATKEIQLSTRPNTSDSYWTEAFATLLSGRNQDRGRQQQQQDLRYNKFKQIEVSINVTEQGKRSRVRANFQAKILDNTGNPVEVYVIRDPKFYQDFFAKVDKGIFLQKQGF